MARKHYNVVAAVVEVDGKVLCMQRGETRYSYTSHLWEFPGGKIEPGRRRNRPCIVNYWKKWTWPSRCMSYWPQ